MSIAPAAIAMLMTSTAAAMLRIPNLLMFILHLLIRHSDQTDRLTDANVTAAGTEIKFLAVSNLRSAHLKPDVICVPTIPTGQT